MSLQAIQSGGKSETPRTRCDKRMPASSLILPLVAGLVTCLLMGHVTRLNYWKKQPPCWIKIKLYYTAELHHTVSFLIHTAHARIHADDAAINLFTQWLLVITQCLIGILYEVSGSWEQLKEFLSCHKLYPKWTPLMHGVFQLFCSVSFLSTTFFSTFAIQWFG